MLFFRDILACATPPLFYRDIFHCGFRSGLCLRCKRALSELKQRVFAYRTTKMLISDDFGVVYRIFDPVDTYTHLSLPLFGQMSSFYQQTAIEGLVVRVPMKVTWRQYLMTSHQNVCGTTMLIYQLWLLDSTLLIP